MVRTRVKEVLESVSLYCSLFLLYGSITDCRLYIRMIFLVSLPTEQKKTINKKVGLFIYPPLSNSSSQWALHGDGRTLSKIQSGKV